MYMFYDISGPSSYGSGLFPIDGFQIQKLAQTLKLGKELWLIIRVLLSGSSSYAPLISFVCTNWAISLITAHPILFPESPYSVIHLPNFLRITPLSLTTTLFLSLITVWARLHCNLSQVINPVTGGKLGADPEGSTGYATKRKPLHGFQARGAQAINGENWTMFRLRGFRGIQGFKIFRYHNPAHCIRVSFQSSTVTVAWPTQLGCVVVDLLWSSASLTIKCWACSSALSALPLQEIKASLSATKEAWILLLNF